MIQVVNRALNILEIIAKNPDRELGLTEIADSVELNHGTCANILKTLVLRGYVEQAGAKKGYKLGYMAYQLTNTISYYNELINASKDLMDVLRDEINETVILSVIKENKRFVLYEAECNHPIQVRTMPESEVYRTTTGRMILSGYSPKELNDFISEKGLPNDDEWPEITSKSDLISYLDDIRMHEMAVTINKNHVVGVALPLFKKGQLMAAIGVDRKSVV